MEAGRTSAPNLLLHYQVEAALAASTLTNPAAVRVETRGDHVSLRGTVTAWWERDEAERLAWAVPGVCHVDNNLSVALAATNV